MLMPEEVGRVLPDLLSLVNLKSERISDDLGSALQVDGQMHVLMPWLMWSWKFRKPPSLTKKVYK